MDTLHDNTSFCPPTTSALDSPYWSDQCCRKWNENQENCAILAHKDNILNTMMQDSLIFFLVSSSENIRILQENSFIHCFLSTYKVSKQPKEVSLMN